MSERILCVDDEVHVLSAYRRMLRKLFHIETAKSGQDALDTVQSDGPFAVVLSDMRMPGMDGVDLLARIRKLVPSTVRIMLTGNSDQQTAMDAVNRGSIFAFLTKPCPPELLAATLNRGIQQYRLSVAEKELLHKTLSGSVKVMCDVLSSVSPIAFGHAARVRQLVKKLAQHLGVGDDWKIEVASMLSQIGAVTVPQDILEKLFRNEQLDAREWDLYQGHAAFGSELVARIPRLEDVAEIIRYQDKLYHGGGVPADNRIGSDIPLGSRLLKVAGDYDRLVTQGLAPQDALNRITLSHGKYDPEILDAIQHVVGTESEECARKVSVDELKEDMTLVEPVISVKGVVLAQAGTAITVALRQRLQNYARRSPIREPLYVRP